MSSGEVFTEQQKIAIQLIRNDFRYAFTIVQNRPQLRSNYLSSALPLLGTIMDGAEDWVKAYNNASKQKLDIPVFTVEEQRYYEEMRNSIKMWDDSYNSVYEKLEEKYQESDQYFSSCCKPAAKFLQLYDIFGADLVNGEFCGNTILCSCYSPNFRFDDGNAEGLRRQKLAEIMGAYVVLFGAMEAYSIDENMRFIYKDYGGIIKSPVGNAFSDSFVLFSLLCQIQFVLICVDKYITEECTTKLRFLYLQYYYLMQRIPEINNKLCSSFSMDNSLLSPAFRNAMAHYKIGVALKPNEIVYGDPFFGLTHKYFNCDYFTAKRFVTTQLMSLASQIKAYLHIDKG